MMNPCNKKLVLIVSFLLVTFLLEAQAPVSQDLLFVKNGYEINPKKDDFMPGKSGFYIYRNCIYNFTLKNKLKLSANVFDIRNDSIYYTTVRGIDSNGVVINDSAIVHPNQIQKIRLLGDRMMGIFSIYSLKNSNYIFQPTIAPRSFTNKYDTVYSADSSQSTQYVVTAYLTAQGIDWIYHKQGSYHHREPITYDSNLNKLLTRRPIIKKVVWFSPTNANLVKGLNIGLMSLSLSDQGWEVRGVNLNGDIFSFILGAYALFNIPFNNALINMNDTLRRSSFSNKINGVSISFGGLVATDEVKGVSINGGICTVQESKGVVITGSQNLIQEFSGVTVSALRNKSTKGRGFQLGLLNICKDFKGIQIGLWNVNSKRKLPFINWSF